MMKNVLINFYFCLTKDTGENRRRLELIQPHSYKTHRIGSLEDVWARTINQMLSKGHEANRKYFRRLRVSIQLRDEIINWQKLPHKVKYQKRGFP